MKSTRRNPSAPKPETADSMKAAAATLKVPIHVLKRLKDAGCPAFRGSRIYINEVTAWLADPKNSEGLASEGGTIDDAKLEILRQRARLLKIRADAEEKLLVPLAEVKRVFTQAVHGAKSRLLRIPRRCAQRLASESDWIAIEKILDDEIYDALESMHRGEWLHAEHCETCGRPSETPTEPPPVEITNPVKVSSK